MGMQIVGFAVLGFLSLPGTALRPNEASNLLQGAILGRQSDRTLWQVRNNPAQACGVVLLHVVANGDALRAASIEEAFCSFSEMRPYDFRTNRPMVPIRKRKAPITGRWATKSGLEGEEG